MKISSAIAALIAFCASIVVSTPPYAQMALTDVSHTVKSPLRLNRVVGVCQEIANNDSYRDTAVNGVDPVGTAKSYFWTVEHRQLGLEALKGKQTLLQSPQHGHLKSVGEGAFLYVPESTSYLGPDRATFLVEIAGMKVKLIFYIKVLAAVGGGSDQDDPAGISDVCPKGDYWRIAVNQDAADATNVSLASPPVSWTGYDFSNVNGQLNIAGLTTRQNPLHLQSQFFLNSSRSASRAFGELPYLR